MTFYFCTYGYIIIQPNIYNLQAFYNSNKEKIDNIIKMTKDSRIGTSIEEDVNNNIVCPFTINGDTYEETEEVYYSFIKAVKENFPSAKLIVRVRSTDTSDGSSSYFNRDHLNPFPDWSTNI